MKQLILLVCLTFSVGFAAEEQVLSYKIKDGDTFEFTTATEKFVCRLNYIDTPEIFHNSKVADKKFYKDSSRCSMKDSTAKYLGLISKQYVSQQFENAKKITVDKKEKDVFNRNLCEVYVNGNKLSEDIVVKGYGYPFLKYLKKSDKILFNGLLVKAKNDKLGLWDQFPEEMDCLVGK